MLSVNSDLGFERKQEQKIAVNCLLKKISERWHPKSVILVICP